MCLYFFYSNKFLNHLDYLLAIHNFDTHKLNQIQIQNILTKIIGSNNPLNVARAVMNALESLQDAVKIATKRGITVKEVFS